MVRKGEEKCWRRPLISALSLLGIVFVGPTFTRWAPQEPGSGFKSDAWRWLSVFGGKRSRRLKKRVGHGFLGKLSCCLVSNWRLKETQLYAYGALLAAWLFLGKYINCRYVYFHLQKVKVMLFYKMIGNSTLLICQILFVRGNNIMDDSVLLA